MDLDDNSNALNTLVDTDIPTADENELGTPATAANPLIIISDSSVANPLVTMSNSPPLTELSGFSLSVAVASTRTISGTTSHTAPNCDTKSSDCGDIQEKLDDAIARVCAVPSGDTVDHLIARVCGDQNAPDAPTSDLKPSISLGRVVDVTIAAHIARVTAGVPSFTALPPVNISPVPIRPGMHALLQSPLSQHRPPVHPAPALNSNMRSLLVSIPAPPPAPTETHRSMEHRHPMPSASVPLPTSFAAHERHESATGDCMPPLAFAHLTAQHVRDSVLSAHTKPEGAQAVPILAVPSGTAEVGVNPPGMKREHAEVLAALVQTCAERGDENVESVRPWSKVVGYERQMAKGASRM
ncbi:hypothetical protein BKA93DRAFT_480177 [Sparassis latifolia]